MDQQGRGNAMNYLTLQSSVVLCTIWFRIKTACILPA